MKKLYTLLMLLGILGMKPSESTENYRVLRYVNYLFNWHLFIYKSQFLMLILILIV